MKRFVFGFIAFLLSAQGLVQAQPKPIIVTFTGGKHDFTDGPVTVPLSLPADLAKQEVVTLTLHGIAQGIRIYPSLGQLTAPGLLTEHIGPSAPGLVRRDMHFRLPSLPAGKILQLKLEFRNNAHEYPRRYIWQEAKGAHTDLFLEKEPVLRYMHKPYDNTTAATRNQTYKVFHHLYDPSGTRLVTNGGQADGSVADEKKLLFPHHRGLMYAFNKISYGSVKGTDTWHAKPGETHQSHAGFVNVEQGPVMARHRVIVNWHGPQDEIFAKEEREITAHFMSGKTLVDFASRLKTTMGKLKLDGDPQHAGFQFRAHNDVAEKTKKETYYLRPDGQGKPGETRNWDPKTKKGPVNLPWNAMSFVLDGQRYSVAYLAHPKNPGETRWSERDYGRFGCYFEHEVTEDRPLVVNYRICLRNGEMTVPEVEALYRKFALPPAITVK